MSDYAGETYSIVTAAIKPSGAQVREVDVTSAVVEVRPYVDGVLGEPIITAQPMIWDADLHFTMEDGTELLGAWYFDWDTDGVAPGQYRGKCSLVGPEVRTFDYVKIRLKEKPF